MTYIASQSVALLGVYMGPFLYYTHPKTPTDWFPLSSGSASNFLYLDNAQERVDNRKTPQNTVKLLTSTIKSGADEEGLRYCFRVVSPEKIYLLQVRFKNIQECLCMHD